MKNRKTMKKLILILLFLTTIFAASNLETEYQKMSNKQKAVLKKSFNLGQPFDFGYTLAAIAWVESNAGKYMINIQDPSFGIYHNNINSVMGRHPDYKDTPFQRNKVAQMLIEDIDFSAAEALAELEYWKNIHGSKRWSKIWASYNGGFNYNGVKPTRYAKKIKKRISVLKKYIR